MTQFGGGPAGGDAGVYGDTTLTKVFVGGLAWETQRETMSRYFEQFGEIIEAVVITDKNTGRSKGYGFVTFRDPESARMACADPTPVIDGRRTNCNLASLGARPRPSSSAFGVIQFRPALPYANIAAAAAAAGVSAPAGSYIGTTPTFSQAAAQYYAYQHAGLYSYPAQYGFPEAYSVDYPYQQSLYSPSYIGGAQYAPIYSAPAVPATASNPTVYTYSAFGQPLLQYSAPTTDAAAATYNMYAAPALQAAYAEQLTPTHLIPYTPTVQTTMPQYAGSVPINTATTPSGYSLQVNSSSSRGQAALQQFFSIATHSHGPQRPLGGGGGGSSDQQPS